MTINDALKEPSALLRAPVAKGVKSDTPIERDGGDYGAGLIRGAAVITRGEALGHDEWIDSTMLEQVATEVNAKDTGAKSRFTHPGLSGDGMGKALGRFRDASVDDDVTRADLHLFASAHDAPDGDLAGYVMDLAKEDPKSFGTSISYMRDIGAEDRIRADNEDEDGVFTSPDKDNVNNYPHARLAELRAVDFVDSPAANPNGLFHRGDEIAKEADEVMEYALGLTEREPVCCELDMHPDRIRGFAQSFLDRHGLKIVPETKGVVMSEDKDKVETEVETKDKGAGCERTEAEDVKAMALGADAEVDRFKEMSDEFKDTVFVAEQFAKGASIQDARQAWTTKEIADLKAQNAELKKQVATKGSNPVTFHEGDDGVKRSFAELARERVVTDGIRLDQAMSIIAKEQPDLYEAYKAG